MHGVGGGVVAQLDKCLEDVFVGGESFRSADSGLVKRVA